MKKKSPIGMPPQQIASKIDLDDPAFKAMVEGGGSVAVQKKKESTTQQGQEAIKNFSIRLFESELNDIKTHLQGYGGRKKKSIHTFMLEAISEKLKREIKL